jgi:hypothetical protein
MQLDPAHAAQLHIDEQASEIWTTGAGEKLLGGSKRHRVKPPLQEQTAERAATTLVVIDYGYVGCWSHDRTTLPTEGGVQPLPRRYHCPKGKPRNPQQMAELLRPRTLLVFSVPSVPFSSLGDGSPVTEIDPRHRCLYSAHDCTLPSSDPDERAMPSKKKRQAAKEVARRTGCLRRANGGTSCMLSRLGPEWTYELKLDGSPDNPVVMGSSMEVEDANGDPLRDYPIAAPAEDSSREIR